VINFFCAILIARLVKKVEKWLNDNNISVKLRDIKENNPTEQELHSWHEKSGLFLKRFFKTSGQKYKELELCNKY